MVEFLAETHKKKGTGAISGRAQRNIIEIQAKVAAAEASQPTQPGSAEMSSSSSVNLTPEQLDEIYFQVYNNIYLYIFICYCY